MKDEAKHALERAVVDAFGAGMTWDEIQLAASNAYDEAYAARAKNAQARAPKKTGGHKNLGKPGH